MDTALAGYIFLAQFLAYLLKGLVGFGNPLIANPLMAMRLDNRVITPANLLLDLPVNSYIVWQNRAALQLKTVLPTLGFIFIGVLPGTFFLKLGSPWVIKAVLGISIIGLGLEMLLRSRSQNMQPKMIWQGIFSISSGLMAGLFGINMLFMAYFERISINRQQFRSNVCFVFLAENVFRAVVYYYSGMFSELSLQVSFISVPAAAFGVAAGLYLDKLLDERRARTLAISAFLLGGISILVKALIFRS